ncbi:amino acid adenylation [Neptunicella sp.]|uniref:amino acid adenylation n=1 Tax=Neptunicella sp. TaxID=2125986 RepID=UPI003F68F109
MQLLISASNALARWLKADFPRLPASSGKQVGVNTLQSTFQQFCWQIHIIENRYKSIEKTIIATEANSRFTLFLPVEKPLTVGELESRLFMEWQYVLAETLETQRLLQRGDIAKLLSDIGDVEFKFEWVKNTDLSINGHITDAGLWVTQTLDDRQIRYLPPELALDIAVYFNSQPKRTKSSKQRFVPVEGLLEYCRTLVKRKHLEDVSEANSSDGSDTSNVIYLKNIKK